MRKVSTKGKLKTARLAGKVAHAPTVRKANEDLDALIEASLTGSYGPALVRWRGWVGLLYRTPDGWESYVKQDSALPACYEGLSTVLHAGDRQRCLDSVLGHIAQNAWVPSDGTGVPLVMAKASREAQGDFVSWCRFQLAAAHARDVLGMADVHAVHTWACEHAEEFS